jgi:hypothetical protein
MPIGCFNGYFFAIVTRSCCKHVANLLEPCRCDSEKGVARLGYLNQWKTPVPFSRTR